jgi:uncharacterized protein (TIRG00374 family)
MIERLKRKLLFSIGLSAVVFLALSLYADWGNLSDALLHLDWIFLPLALFLALVNYGLRFLRWQYYLHQLDIALHWRESLVVFLAGLILSVTPGKAGELLKAYFIKERLQTPISQSVPAVIGERLTDVISLIFLGLIGVYSFQVGLMPLLIASAVLLLGVLALGVPRLMHGCIGLFAQLPILNRFGNALHRGYDSLARLITMPALFRGVALGLLAWFSECLAFYFVLKGFGVQSVGVVAATFIYCFATLFGAATLLPGGLGSTEGSMVGLLLYIGVVRPDAVGATLVVRLCTLWFAVGIGAYVLLRYRRYFEWEMEPDAKPDVLETETG